MNFTLVDQRLLAFMNEFYGIFNGQDMLILGGVDIIDHRCHGSTFTGTRRSGYRNQATGIVGDILKYLAHAKLFHGKYLEGIVLKTAAAPRFWTKALTLKRAKPGTSNEKSDSRCSS